MTVFTERIGDAHRAETLACAGGLLNINLYVMYHIICLYDYTLCTNVPILYYCVGIY